MTTLSGLKSYSPPWFPFESLDPSLISTEKILPMGISRLSSESLIVPPNSNTFVFMMMMKFTAASGLVGSGSFVTERISTRRGKRFIPNSGTKH